MLLFSNAFGSRRAVSDFACRHLYYCNRAGYICNNPEFVIDRQHLDNYLLLHVVSGLFHTEVKGRQQTVKPGETILIDLKQPHRYWSDRKQACEVLWLDFNCSEDKLTFLRTGTDWPYQFNNQAIQPLIHEFVLQYVHDSGFSEIRQSELIYRMLLLGIDEQKREGEMAPGFAAAEAYIRQHIGNRITLEQLAGQEHLSVCHFCHQFKKHYHQTPMRFVLQQRMDRAVYLLAYSNLSITEIASELGFCSQSHFSRTFQKQYNTYPRQYREALLKQMRRT